MKIRVQFSLNPRFDGAFLNWNMAKAVAGITGLNPRFDGAFLNLKLIALKILKL